MCHPEHSEGTMSLLLDTSFHSDVLLRGYPKNDKQERFNKEKLNN